MQILSHERGAETATAVKDELGPGVRAALLDVSFDHPFAHMHRAGDMTPRPFVVFPHVDENELFTGIHALLHVRDIRLFDKLLCVLNKFQKFR